MSVLFSLSLVARAADVTCDGYDDLVIAVDGDNGILVVHGGASGLTGTNTWRRSGDTHVGSASDFGRALGAADVDQDGCDELAVGSSDGLFLRQYDTFVLGGHPASSENWVSYGPELLGVTADQTQITGLVGGSMNTTGATREDFFLGAWANDVSGDLYPFVDASLLRVADDGSGGLRTPGYRRDGEHLDHLALGDLDGDGYDDLVAGGYSHPTDSTVEVYFGGVSPQTSPLETWTQEDIGLETSDYDDYFGNALAIGDFDDDGYGDLVIGAAGETGYSGAVTVIPGGPGGPDLQAAELLRPGVGGIQGISGDHAFFGNSLAVGDFDGDGYDDLAVGASTSYVFEDWSGAVHVIYGSNNGLTSTGDQIWGQDSSGIQGGSEWGDAFGQVVTTGDYDDDGYDDLAIAAPGEEYDGVDDAGAVHVLYGSSSGITSSGNDLYTQNSASIPDSCETDDRFGYRMY